MAGLDITCRFLPLALDDRSTSAHLLTDLTADGLANRLIIVDPRSRLVSVSGELRIIRSPAEGPRLHALRLSSADAIGSSATSAPI